MTLLRCRQIVQITAFQIITNPLCFCFDPEVVAIKFNSEVMLCGGVIQTLLSGLTANLIIKPSVTASVHGDKLVCNKERNDCYSLILDTISLCVIFIIVRNFIWRVIGMIFGKLKRYTKLDIYFDAYVGGISRCEFVYINDVWTVRCTALCVRTRLKMTSMFFFPMHYSPWMLTGCWSAICPWPPGCCSYSCSGG
jgi:hypothetical protein